MSEKTPYPTEAELEAGRKERNAARDKKYAALTAAQMENWRAKQSFAASDIEGAPVSIFGSPIRQAAAIQRAFPDPSALQIVQMEKADDLATKTEDEKADALMAEAARLTYGGGALFLAGPYLGFFSPPLMMVTASAGVLLTHHYGGKAYKRYEMTEEANKVFRRLRLKEIKDLQKEAGFYHLETPWRSTHFRIHSLRSDAESRAEKRKNLARKEKYKGFRGKIRRMAYFVGIRSPAFV